MAAPLDRTSLANPPGMLPDDHPFRRVNAVLQMLHDRIESMLTPGVPASRVDDVSDEFLRDQGVEAAFPGYNGYRHTISLCRNEEVVHSPPAENKVLRDGDLVTVDCAARLEGWFGDLARSTVVGEGRPGLRALARAPGDAVREGLDRLRPGTPVAEFSRHVQQFGRSRGFGIVTEFGGHGIGRSLHQPPTVPNAPVDSDDAVFREGMAVAVEPIYTLGGGAVRIEPDGWTARTKDGSLCAHSETVVHLTEDGPEILAN